MLSLPKISTIPPPSTPSNWDGNRAKGEGTREQRAVKVHGWLSNERCGKILSFDIVRWTGKTKSELCGHYVGVEKLSQSLLWRSYT